MDIQYNYYPISIALPSGTPSPTNPVANVLAVAVSPDNIVPAAGGSILKDGFLQSPNYVKGISGWKIDAAGNAEFQVVTAAGYTQVFRQASIPTSLHINDIWIDTDDSNKYYVAASVGADQIAAGEWVLTTPAAAWSTVVDDDGNKPANNATVGSTAGTDLKDSGAVVLADTDIKNIYTLTAGMAITAGQAVFIYTDGKVYSTDAFVAGHTTPFLGFALENIASDASGKIKVIGTIENLTGLTVGSSHYLKDAVQTIDQQCDSALGETNVGISGASEVNYQSFTAGQTHISKFRIYVLNLSGGNAYDLTVRLRSGEGVGGTQLATFTVSCAIGFSGWKECVLTVPLTVVAGNKYSITAFCTTVPNDMKWLEDTGGGYAGGRNDVNANYDYCFTVYYTTGRGAVATTPGSNSKKVGLGILTTNLLLLNS